MLGRYRLRYGICLMPVHTVAGSVLRVHATQRSDTSPRATRREWVGLAVLALPCLLYSMDLEVLYLAAPSIAADLQPSGTQMLWIVDIYGFLLAGSLITMGTLGDRIGRRRPMRSPRRPIVISELASRNP